MRCSIPIGKRGPVKLTIVTHLCFFSERIAIANLSLLPCVIKKNMNASKPSEHPLSGDKMSKGLGGNIGCRDKTSSWYQTGSPMWPHRVNSIISGRNPSLYCDGVLIRQFRTGVFFFRGPFFPTYEAKVIGIF